MDWRLQKKTDLSAPEGPVVVVVMDGVGVGPDNAGNAVRIARTPTLDRLAASAPYRTLRAHGTAVGLPSDDDMGNSEVGHNAIGAGRVFAQGAKLVNQAIELGAMWEGTVWRQMMTQCMERKSALHLIGLLSDGNVHSHIDHLFAMISEADRTGVGRIRVHPLIDGRDVPDQTALDYIERLEAHLGPMNARDDRDYRIASGGGRMVTTMDRYEADWRIVERGYRAHVLGEGDGFATARAAIESLREKNPGVMDQDLPPFVIRDDDGPVGRMQDGDCVIFFNFRGDRALEISRAFDDDDFTHFDRKDRPQVLYAGIMQYDGDYNIPKRFLVDPPAIDRTMGEYLARNGISQFACSETQKYGHVTYFWNGNRGGKFDDALEDYVEITSDLVPFWQRPWMKAAEISDATIAAIESGKHRFIRINYANGDMVGHTGNHEAAILAVQALDLSLGRLLTAVERAGGLALITADHGNADEMYGWDKKKSDFKRDAKGAIELKTSHTLNPVPLYLFDPARPDKLRFRDDLPEAGIANIAATSLNLLGFEAPEDFEPSLLAPLDPA